MVQKTATRSISIATRMAQLFGVTAKKAMVEADNDPERKLGCERRMQIIGRNDTPWETLFVFHLYAPNSLNEVPKALQKMVGANEANPIAQSLTIDRQQIAISGRSFDKSECTSLLSAWNEPDSNNWWMCYWPNHGIATATSGKIDWWALICLQCQNAGIGGPQATAKGSPPNRSLPQGLALQDQLFSLLPERPFPIREA